MRADPKDQKLVRTGTEPVSAKFRCQCNSSATRLASRSCTAVVAEPADCRQGAALPAGLLSASALPAGLQEAR